MEGVGEGNRERRTQGGEEALWAPKVKPSSPTRALNAILSSLDAPLHDGEKRAQSDARELSWGGADLMSW